MTAILAPDVAENASPAAEGVFEGEARAAAFALLRDELTLPSAQALAVVPAA